MPYSKYELRALVDKYFDQEKMHNFEGRRGLENLAKLARVLGYKDWQNYGQLANGAALGDIFEFLEDNSGAMSAIVTWVEKTNLLQWRQAIENELIEPLEEDEEDEEDESNDE